jgi:predicted transcriptional regulator
VLPLGSQGQRRGRLHLPVKRLCRAVGFRINEYMKQLLVEIDEGTFEKLERVAPARSRRRSAFIRAAIQRAICETQERATAAAYRRTPDSADEAWFDPRVWEAKPPAYRGRRRR